MFTETSTNVTLVNRDAYVEEEVFYFCHHSNKPSMEEYRHAQPASGYPIRLPLGLKSLRTQDDPDVIKAYTDFFGSLMRATEKPAMDQFQARDCCSSMTINVLTVNHGNLTRNTKLDGRELKSMPDRAHECSCTTVLASYASMKRTHFSTPKAKNARNSFVYPLRIHGHCDQILVCKANRMFYPCQ